MAGILLVLSIAPVILSPDFEMPINKFYCHPCLCELPLKSWSAKLLSANLSLYINRFQCEALTKQNISERQFVHW